MRYRFPKGNKIGNRFKNGNTFGFKKGHKINLGRLQTKETIEKIIKSNEGKHEHLVTYQIKNGERRSQKTEFKTGNKPKNYIEDRTKLKIFGDDSKDRRSYRYSDWRKQVWLRDNFKCKIDNPDCKGRIEAHHILNYKEYPELRYQLNNGITLCHAHHPKRRAEEKRLTPYFQELVSVSKDKIW